MDLVRLFLSNDPRGAYVVNLILCIVGGIWVLGVPSSLRASRHVWLGWLIFWFATGFYYFVAAAATLQSTGAPEDASSLTLCPLACCVEPTRVAFHSRLIPPVQQIGLYVATAALIWAFLRKRSPTCGWTLPLLLVAAAAGLDVMTWRFSGLEHAGVHQTLTAVTIGAWAWDLNRSDHSKSATLVLYALVQLPVQPALATLGIQTNDYEHFVQATFAIYAVLKLALIPVVCYLVTDKSSGGVEGPEALQLEAVDDHR